MDAEERKTAMSHDEMQDYWKTLCSFTGEDIPNEVNQLMAKICYPRFLYKYRAVNSLIFPAFGFFPFSAFGSAFAHNRVLGKALCLKVCRV